MHLHLTCAKCFHCYFLVFFLLMAYIVLKHIYLHIHFVFLFLIYLHHKLLHSLQTTNPQLQKLHLLLLKLFLQFLLHPFCLKQLNLNKLIHYIKYIHMHCNMLKHKSQLLHLVVYNVLFSNCFPILISINKL